MNDKLNSFVLPISGWQREGGGQEETPRLIPHRPRRTGEVATQAQEEEGGLPKAGFQGEGTPETEHSLVIDAPEDRKRKKKVHFVDFFAFCRVFFDHAVRRFSCFFSSSK